MYYFGTIDHLKEEAFHTLIASCASVLVRSGIDPNHIDIVYSDIGMAPVALSTFATIFTRTSDEPEIDPITGKLASVTQFTICRMPGKSISVTINSMAESDEDGMIPTVDFCAYFDDPKYDNKPMFEVTPIIIPTKPDDQMKFAWFVGMFTAALSAMLNLPAPSNPNETLEEIQNQLMGEDKMEEDKSDEE